MVTMSFGEHIEELRVRLILALLGLVRRRDRRFPPAARYRLAGHDEAWRSPAKVALDDFYKQEYQKKTEPGRAGENRSRPTVQAIVEAELFVAELKKIAPKLELPEAETLKGKTLNLPLPVLPKPV